MTADPYRDFHHSKTLAALAERDPRIAEYYADDDGHWVHLKPGYRRKGYGSGTIRKDTVKEVLEAVRHEIEEGATF